ncbi:hypothetical protein GCM10010329_62310 [Streptomyces spiroverticillatus]|uniref:Uncharacterized protein n=1 Tax=Streptomyces finlayi TaxID=67296 RepID=A0A918X6K4_9ACTN|nr:hypothetical protein GCM10010329_62310 [Streptomyces spiroverticillatus]GHD14743.1 hypothetical protein GCM10010334_74120 [Streptomyces finlayi]
MHIAALGVQAVGCAGVRKGGGKPHLGGAGSRRRSLVSSAPTPQFEFRRRGRLRSAVEREPGHGAVTGRPANPDRKGREPEALEARADRPGDMAVPESPRGPVRNRRQPRRLRFRTGPVSCGQRLRVSSPGR